MAKVLKMLNISLFDKSFKQRLYKEIADIEKQSLAEVVVIIRAKSANYHDVSLWFGFVLQVVVLLYLLFSPQVFNPYWICFAGVISFLFGFSIVELLPVLKRVLTKSKRKKHAVEVYARALFQKGAVYDTREHTGLLIFVSLLEQMVFLVPDKGLLLRIPEHIWEEISQEFNKIFKEEDLVTDALLSKLTYLKPLLAQYVPPVENDINEIPDDLEINL